MAAYPELDVSNLATQAGEDVSAYTNLPFVDEAIRQATLLFKVGTCLSAFPDNELDAELAETAIVAMADAIYWAQPFQAVLRNPFSSETIGSYSYSKLQQAVSAGLPTGVSWFDYTVGKLSVCDTNGQLWSGGTNVFEEVKIPHDGYGAYYGPADQFPDNWGIDTVAPPGAPEVY